MLLIDLIIDILYKAKIGIFNLSIILVYNTWKDDEYDQQ